MVTLPLLVNLALNGVVLGTLLFLTAAGLSLIFGLMHVLNLAHGAFFTWGAYVGLSTYAATGSFGLAVAAGVLAGAALGVVVETVFIRRQYGDHMLQILLTLGLFLVLHEALRMIWGPSLIGFDLPAWAQGTFPVLGMPISRYRMVLLVLGAAVFGLVYLLLTRTRFGIIVRAGVENAAMVEALGINVRRVFTLVFVLGAALAAFGGVAAGPFFRVVWPEMGQEMLLSTFIVVVIGGLGSFTGSAVGALLVGLSQAFVGYFYPDAALIVNVALMAVVLLLRPQGLFAAGH